jgi:hypothetical protein
VPYLVAEFGEPLLPIGVVELDAACRAAAGLAQVCTHDAVDPPMVPLALRD